MVALLYDHSLTFGEEINLICTAPRSFLKWVFLTNHYMVEMCLIVIAHGAYCRVIVSTMLNYRLLETSGFNPFMRNDRVSTTCISFHC